MVKEKLKKIGKSFKKLITIDNPKKLLRLNLIVIGIVLLGLIVNGVYRESHAASVGSKYETVYSNNSTVDWEYPEGNHRHYMTLKGGGETLTAYCIDHTDRDLGDGGTRTAYLPTSTSYWNNHIVGQNIDEYLSLATTFGGLKVPSELSGCKNYDLYNATQLLIWHYENYGKTGTGTSFSDNGEYNSMNSCAKRAYTYLLDQMTDFLVVPSFCVKGQGGNGATTIVMKHSYTNNNFSTTVTDTNGNNHALTVSGNISPVTFSQNVANRTYTFSSNSEVSTKVINFLKRTNGSDEPLVWLDGDKQEAYSGNIPVDIWFSTKVRTENPGYLVAKKTSDDIVKHEDGIQNVFEDIRFQVTGNGLEAGDLTLTVDDDGNLLFYDGNAEVKKKNTKGSSKIAIYPGTYTLTEINLPDRYIEPISETFTITEGNTTSLVYDDPEFADGYIPPTSVMNSTHMHNFIKKGYIAIQKYFSNEDGEDIGSSVHLKPEEGAVFRVYSKEYADAGWTYDRIPLLYKDTITTGANGYARTKALPYGTYWVEQTDGSETSFRIEKFAVSITEHEETYLFPIFNEDVHAKLKIIKVDSETGKTIPYAGISFKIKNKQTGEYVTMSDGKPTPSQIDTFTTDSSGTVTLPGHLTYGTYQIVEVKAPEGYYRNPEGVEFTVDASSIEQANGGAVNDYSDPIVVKFPDKPQKANLNITKLGEEVEIGEDNGPEYTTKPLRYVEFEIIAAEDIYTPDGTLRVEEGETVKKVMTDSSGKASVTGLYLGKYHIYERAIYDRHLHYTYTEEQIEEIALRYEEYLLENYSASTDVIDNVNEAMKEEPSEGADVEEELTESEKEALINEFKEILKGGIYVNGDGTIYKETDDEVVEDAVMREIIREANKSITYASEEFVPITTDYNFDPEKPIETITLEYSDQDTEINYVNKTYTNRIKKGDFELSKTDISTGEVIPGAEIRVYTEGGEKVCQGTTDNDGKFGCEKLPVGKYYFQEFASPPGYILNPDRHYFTIDKDGEVEKANLPNELDYTYVPITDSDRTFIIYVIASIFIVVGSGISIGIIKKEEIMNFINKIKGKLKHS